MKRAAFRVAEARRCTGLTMPWVAGRCLEVERRMHRLSADDAQCVDPVLSPRYEPSGLTQAQT
jgi:hypothetical protein